MQAEAAPGVPEPLGAWLTEEGASFAWPAPDAAALFVCLFDAQDRELARIRLPGRTDDVHHGTIAGVVAGMRYGLRAEGPWDPVRGHRFNPAKLLVDPWARALDRPFALHPAFFDTAEHPDGTDSAPFLPKALLAPALPPAVRRARPAQPQLIYELHVKGFTARHPKIPEAIRGSFAALGHPAAIEHLLKLGVSTVELMPAAAWVDERHLPALGLSNHWGYNPVALLCPDPRLAPGGMAEVRAAVAALQDAGLAVIQDVVLNHIGESDHLGPTLSLRGLANASFYRLQSQDRWRYVDDTGCGNALALDRPWALRLAMDALRHWAEAAGLDGFRLDLATTLARREGGFDRDAPLIQAMRQDPVLRERIIIAEPWDIGEGGYRLGQFPAGWGEWNDRFRDDVRRFWRADRGMLGPLATRLAGSTDLFRQRPSTDSVNYVAAHDGFTLADLVAFTRKRNEANGEQGLDGTDANYSWNNGVEGPSADEEVLARRRRDIRALLATLLVARGTPMLGMGDEGGRSQGGNNNAYAQDNAANWLDWEGMDAGLLDFARHLIAIRRAHPALTDAVPLSGRAEDGTLPDVAWLRPEGGAMRDADWADPDRHALVAVLHARGDRCLVALNAGSVALPLSLPAPRAAHRWQLLADSAEPERRTATPPQELPARAVLLLAEEPVRKRRDDPALLGRLAQAAGIATHWYEISGRRHEVPAETLRPLLAALGLPAADDGTVRDQLAALSRLRTLPPSHRCHADAPSVPLALAERSLRLRLRLEDGGELALDVMPEDGATHRLTLPDGRAAARRLVALPPLLEGRHLLFDEAAPELSCHLAVVPRRAFVPHDIATGGTGFGIAAQIYGLRRAGDQGIGDFRAVAELARVATREGAALLGLSPPHALCPTDRNRASPYYPSDRRFLDPIFLDVATLPLVADLPELRAALDEHASIFAALSARDAVDHPAVWQAKHAVLQAAWRGLPPEHPARGALRAFLKAGGRPLLHFCAFTVIAGQQGHPDARNWPEGLRHGEDSGVAAFAEQHADALGFVAFQQMLAELQMEEAGGAGAGLYRDLAVGAAPDGSEPWSGDARFLKGFVIGAPPDPFAPDGQVWGLSPPDPQASRADGHAAFARLLRANMRHAAALRIDHVLGLRRLFLVPDGASGREGTYLTYPFQELLGQVTLESQRARCLVVGEDLGTVPEGTGEALQSSDVFSYRVLWFERREQDFKPPAEWPARAAACVSTHDLPTLAGFWIGADLEERAALGMLLDLPAALAERAGDRIALCELLAREGLLPEGSAHDGPLDDELAAAIHALVARTPSALMLVQAEDLAGAVVAVNLPGTDRERPNWRRRLPVPAEDLVGLRRARAVLDRLRALRPG